MQEERNSLWKEEHIGPCDQRGKTIRVVLIIILVLQMFSGLLDVKGAFLLEEFEPNKKPILMRILEGLENEYTSSVLLKLLVPIYGLKKLLWNSGRSL